MYSLHSTECSRRDSVYTQGEYLTSFTSGCNVGITRCAPARPCQCHDLRHTAPHVVACLYMHQVWLSIRSCALHACFRCYFIEIDGQLRCGSSRPCPRTLKAGASPPSSPDVLTLADCSASVSIFAETTPSLPFSSQ